MEGYYRNPFIDCELLPVDVVFHPSWWYKNAGISFDRDFFYHPLRRVEAERQMEQVLYNRFGKFGPGEDRDKDLPMVGAVHNASGYILSEMLGCQVIYKEDSAPQVIPQSREQLQVNEDEVFKSPAFRNFVTLQEKMKEKYGYLTGDINWSGILNLAMDLTGDKVFLDFYLEPEETKKQFRNLSSVIEKFVRGVVSETGTSSVSVNRNVRNIRRPVFLHSECSHTMISTEQYQEFLLPYDLAWSQQFRPFGIHYCGHDPHRYAEVFGTIPNLDFLDVGWGGDIRMLREHLPHTFLNIRLDPVRINDYSDAELEQTVSRLVSESGNPFLTGVCCINMDDRTEDAKIGVIFQTVNELRNRFIRDMH